MSSKKPKSVKNRLQFSADRSSDHYTEIRHMSFWQILNMLYPLNRDDLARGLVGETMMPLEALLHGAPPACNSIGVEMTLWQAAFDGEHPGHVLADTRLITEIAHRPFMPHLDQIATVRGLVPSDAKSEHFHRCDYWSAMLGDLGAAQRLQAVYGKAPGLAPYFLDALEEYCETLKKRSGDAPAFRPGLGCHLLIRAAQRSISKLEMTISDLTNVEEWGKARREEAHEASQEALVQHRDFLGQTLVDAALDYLADKRADDAIAAMRAHEKAQAKAAKSFAVNLFDSWRKRVAAGEQVSDADCKAAAEEIIYGWEAEQDRQVNLDTRDMKVVMDVLNGEVDRLSLDKIRDEQTKALEELAKLPKEERSKQAGKAEIRGMGPIEALNAANMLAADYEFLSPEDRQDAELASAIAEAESKNTSIQVLPHIDVTGHKPDGGDILHQAAKLGGQLIPQNLAIQITEARGDLVAAWPHAVAVIDRLLGDLTEFQPVAFRPTVLVGAPGSGKTSLLRSIAEALAQPYLVYGCAGICDSSFTGTSAQWGSKRLSVPLEQIRQTQFANPVIILDELEKTGSYTNGGRLHDALLPLLEAHSAKAFFETGIERKSDLSHVSYIATANTIDGIPPPLRDRFRIVRMPDPGPEHIGDLAKGILDRIIAERGLDTAWTPPLQGDEVDIIRQAWSGGSLRRLRRAVEATLDAREAVLRQAVM